MNKLGYILTGLVFLAISGLYVLHFYGGKKIAYVRSNELVYAYQGMKDAQKDLEGKKKVYQANIDTLKMDIQRSVAQFNEEFAKLSKEEKIEKQKLLYVQQENYKEYASDIENSIEESDTELTQGVLNQINSFIENYAKENGYELVFGTTASGNILYGEDYMDITDDVLKKLNAQYKPVPPTKAVQ